MILVQLVGTSDQSSEANKRGILGKLWIEPRTRARRVIAGTPHIELHPLNYLVDHRGLHIAQELLAVLATVIDVEIGAHVDLQDVRLQLLVEHDIQTKEVETLKTYFFGLRLL